MSRIFKFLAASSISSLEPIPRMIYHWSARKDYQDRGKYFQATSDPIMLLPLARLSVKERYSLYVWVRTLHVCSVLDHSNNVCHEQEIARSFRNADGMTYIEVKNAIEISRGNLRKEGVVYWRKRKKCGKELGRTLRKNEDVAFCQYNNALFLSKPISGFRCGSCAMRPCQYWLHLWLPLPPTFGKISINPYSCHIWTEATERKPAIVFKDSVIRHMMPRQIGNYPLK